MTQTESRTTARTGWAPVRVFAAGFGAVYLVVALAGFAITGVHGWTDHMHSTLIVFGVNPLHNTIHLAMGVAWLASCGSVLWSRRTSLAIGLVLALVTVAGVLDLLGFLGMMGGLADPDNLLHLSTAALALYFATVGAERRVQPEPEAVSAW